MSLAVPSKPPLSVDESGRPLGLDASGLVPLDPVSSDAWPVDVESRVVESGSPLGLDASGLVSLDPVLSVAWPVEVESESDGVPLILEVSAAVLLDGSEVVESGVDNPLELEASGFAGLAPVSSVPWSVEVESDADGDPLTLELSGAVPLDGSEVVESGADDPLALEASGAVWLASVSSVV